MKVGANMPWQASTILPIHCFLHWKRIHLELCHSCAQSPARCNTARGRGSSSGWRSTPCGRKTSSKAKSMMNSTQETSTADCELTWMMVEVSAFQASPWAPSQVPSRERQTWSNWVFCCSWKPQPYLPTVVKVWVETHWSISSCSEGDLWH